MIAILGSTEYNGSSSQPYGYFLEFGRSWNLQKWNGYGWLNAETKADFGGLTNLSFF